MSLLRPDVIKQNKPNQTNTLVCYVAVLFVYLINMKLYMKTPFASQPLISDNNSKDRNDTGTLLSYLSIHTKSTYTNMYKF